MKRAFTRYCNASLTNDEENNATMLNPVVLASAEYGSEFFTDLRNGLRMKEAIKAYSGHIQYIVEAFNLTSGLIGLGLESARWRFGQKVWWWMPF